MDIHIIHCTLHKHHNLSEEVMLIKKDTNYLIFSFFMISIFCWILEVIYSLIDRSKLVYPGSWYGPYCPIYGLTFVLLILIIDKKKNIFINIIKTFITVVIMEYIIAFISEKILDKKIWNYTNEFLNIDGRVCLKMSIIFTILGLFLVYVVDPILKKVFVHIRKVKIINIIFSILFIIDIIFTLIK